MGWQSVWRPFRSDPEPVSVEAPAPVQEDVPGVEPAPAPKPLPVSRTVRDAANVLAQRVWDTNAQPQDHLLRGINPPDGLRCLAYGIAQDWVQVDENSRVSRGRTNPRPIEPVAVTASEALSRPPKASRRCCSRAVL